MKRALIVDDSRLARAILSRLLTQHGVATDTAESAEVALDYLKHSRPDVVFLDHNMPGMGGFEALETIKKNPSTATIPVMMYTSQEGELYVGQARALGALGVLPKTLQPVEVVNVLRGLHLIPATGEPDAAPAATQTSAPSPAPSTAARPLDAESLRELLESLFTEHASSLRGEMRRELQRLSAAAAAAAPALAPLQPPAPIEPRGTTPLRGQRALKIASALLIAVSGVLGYLYFETRTSLDEANERTRRLANDIAAISDVRTPAVAASKPTRGTEADNVLEVLEWGVNQGGRYAFGAIPLDDERATALTALLAQLGEIEFTGTVTIDVHVGRFCMNYRSDGMFELAPPQQPAATCEQFGWPESEAVALGQRQSLAFANTVASAIARNPNLRVENVSHGSAVPAVEYPLVGYELTAGAWNAVAATNHRVEVHLIASDTAAGARR
jgi:CheY-like chemotaxis protein